MSHRTLGGHRMQQVGIWQVTEDGPKKVSKGGIDLEQYLEDWIERDPSLLQTGLKVVGRQIGVESGTLDLLALDPQGSWAVIEIKRGTVRRDTVAQALDYASCIATMPYDELSQKVNNYLRKRETSLEALLEERGPAEDAEHEVRDVITFVVGTDRDPGLERLVNYLSGHFNVPINVVSYQVFEVQGGQQILVRELTESEAKPPSGPKVTVEDICAAAQRSGIGKEFEIILEAAWKHRIYPRPIKHCVMYTPASKRTRTLFTVWAGPLAGGLLSVYVVPAAFAEFYMVTEEEAISILGPEGWRRMTTSDVEAFVANLDRLFESMEQAE